jgi:hypothetical protein
MLWKRGVNDSFLKRLSSERTRAISQLLVDWQLDTPEFHAILDSWFSNFDWKDKELAYKILTKIEYYTASRISRFLRDLQGPIVRRISALGLDGYNLRIVTPDGGGDSAHRHAYDFLKAWDLPRAAVCSLSDLEQEDLSQFVLIFFNDTHGSGKQFLREVWPSIDDRVPKPAAAFIVCITLAAEAKLLFEEKLGRRVHIFPESPTPSVRDTFYAVDLDAINRIGTQIYPVDPLGFGNTALLTAYYFQCPNNSLPLIWADGKNNAIDGRQASPWSPLFPYRPKPKNLGDSNQSAERGRKSVRLPLAGVLDMPGYSWIDDLTGYVRDGKWTRIQVLPGNGAEDVTAILKQWFPDDCVVFVDLATIPNAEAVLGCIANAGHAPLIEMDRISDLNHYQIARTVAGNHGRLLIVLGGWGAHAQIYGRESLTLLAMTLQGFKNVARVVLVCLSPTPMSHLLAMPLRVGSLLVLESVLPSVNDVDVLAKWASPKLSGLPPSEVQALIDAAAGQLGAIREAVRAAGRPQAERLRAIKLAHEKAGLEIFHAAGPCCAAVLRGDSLATGCQGILKNVGIIEENEGKYRPVIGEWSDAWVLEEPT